MEIVVKRASREDIADVTNLFNLYRVFYKNPSDPEAARQFISERLRNDDSVIFIARSANGEALGFTQLYPSFSSQSMQRMWILNDLYVAESHRQTGVANRLLDAARDFSESGASKGLMLCTQVANRKAQSLYMKFGFAKLSEFEWYFLNT